MTAALVLNLKTRYPGHRGCQCQRVKTVTAVLTRDLPVPPGPAAWQLRPSLPGMVPSHQPLSLGGNIKFLRVHIEARIVNGGGRGGGSP